MFCFPFWINLNSLSLEKRGQENKCCYLTVVLKSINRCYDCYSLKAALIICLHLTSQEFSFYAALTIYVCFYFKLMSNAFLAYLCEVVVADSCEIGPVNLLLSRFDCTKFTELVLFNVDFMLESFSHVKSGVGERCIKYVRSAFIHQHAPILRDASQTFHNEYICKWRFYCHQQAFSWSVSILHAATSDCDYLWIFSVSCTWICMQWASLVNCSCSF